MYCVYFPSTYYFAKLINVLVNKCPVNYKHLTPLLKGKFIVKGDLSTTEDLTTTPTVEHIS